MTEAAHSRAPLGSEAIAVQLMCDLHGWASTNYTLSEDPPAVLINPEADALTLLSWGFGQLQQCNAVLDALSAAGLEMPETSAQGVGAVLHFSAQAEQVLKVGIERLRRPPPTD